MEIYSEVNKHLENENTENPRQVRECLVLSLQVHLHPLFFLLSSLPSLPFLFLYSPSNWLSTHTAMFFLFVLSDLLHTLPHEQLHCNLSGY